MDSLGLSTYVFYCSVSCSITQDVALGVNPAALLGPRRFPVSRNFHLRGRPSSAPLGCCPRTGTRYLLPRGASHWVISSRDWGSPTHHGKLSRRRILEVDVHPPEHTHTHSRRGTAGHGEGKDARPGLPYRFPSAGAERGKGRWAR